MNIGGVEIANPPTVSATSSAVPTYVGPTDATPYTVAENTQVLSGVMVVNEGTWIIDGDLVEVN